MYHTFPICFVSGAQEPLMVSNPFSPGSHGKHTKELASLLDITPTVLDWFNVSYPNYTIVSNRNKVNLTGNSLLPLTYNRK